MKEQLKKILKEVDFPPMTNPEINQEEQPTLPPTEEPTKPMKDVPWEKPDENTYPVEN